MAPRPRDLLAVAEPRRVWLVTGAHAVNEFYSVALPPIIPLLVADFDITYGQAGALLTVFYLMYSVFQLPAGVVADRVGQKRLLAAGMVALAGGVLVAGFAPDYRTLLLAQALAGIGGSTYHPSGMSLISDIETGGTEGRAMGIHGLGGVVGTALAPAVIGGIAAVADWRTALLAGALIGVGYAGVFALAFVEPDATEAAADGGGTGSDPRERLAGIVNVPVAWWVAGLFLTNLLLSVEVNTVRTFATAYLFERAGQSTAVSNGVFFAMLVGGGVASVAAGDLADRVDRKALGAVLLVLATAALLATTVVPPAPVLLLGWFFLLGLIVFAAIPAMNAIVSAYSEREFSGGLFGVTLTAGSIGGGAGPLIFGVVAERFGMAVAFPSIGLVSLLGAASFVALYRG